MYKIIADSSCDLHNLETIPISIYNDEITYIDDQKMDIHDMIERFSVYRGRTYTACPGGEAWLKAFEGHDEIYAVTLTSSLSGTYNSAENARKIYLEDHPHAKVKVFDTLSTGPGMVLVIEKIGELKEQGCSFDEVCMQMDLYLKRFRLFFALRSLHNLAQNGRVNKMIASAVGALGLSIIATASPHGTIDSCGKSRGDRKTVRSMIKQMIEAGYTGGKVRCDHVENKSLGELFKQELLSMFPQADVDIIPARGLVSYYAERGAILVACEIDRNYR